MAMGHGPTTTEQQAQTQKHIKQQNMHLPNLAAFKKSS